MCELALRMWSAPTMQQVLRLCGKPMMPRC
nr:MAG TPA: Protein of unknown function (DUF2845) [Caudoviricetes sp.]